MAGASAGSGCAAPTGRRRRWRAWTGFWPAVGSSIAIHRSLALEALLEAALAPVRMGVRLTGVAAADGRVRAAFDDGGTASYDVVIGSDGAGSAVRGLLWPGEAASYGGESWWRGIVTCPPALDDWTLTLCRAGNLILIPVGARMAYWGAARAVRPRSTTSVPAGPPGSGSCSPTPPGSPRPCSIR